jgi:signal transduction histidine kinase
LAAQTSLAVQLIRLAKTARRSAVLEERNRLAGEIHDSLAQSFAAIATQLSLATEVRESNEGDGFRYLDRAKDLARFGVAEARRTALSLHPFAAELLSQNGFGLINMQNRAKKIGANLDIRTDVGHGTAVVVRLPISASRFT